jgi:D-arabinono-1,4-lactone oxidase
MDRLTTLFDKPGSAAPGNFITELYGAENSPFWLSPAYETDSFRVDVFWWAYNAGNPRKHFALFWDALLDVPGARLHWGKQLPDPGKKYGSVVFNPQFLKNAYPKFEAWHAIRRQMDPRGIFLSPYWRKILGS